MPNDTTEMGLGELWCIATFQDYRQTTNLPRFVFLDLLLCITNPPIPFQSYHSASPPVTNKQNCIWIQWDAIWDLFREAACDPQAMSSPQETSCRIFAFMDPYYSFQFANLWISYEFICSSFRDYQFTFTRRLIMPFWSTQTEKRASPKSLLLKCIYCINLWKEQLGAHMPVYCRRSHMTFF